MAYRRSNFTLPENHIVIGQPNGQDNQKVIVYVGEYEGRKTVRIHNVWQDRYGDWNPGKCVTLGLEQAPAIFAELGKLAGRQW